MADKSSPSPFGDAISNALKLVSDGTRMSATISALRRKELKAAINNLNGMDHDTRDHFINICKVAAALAAEVNERGRFDESQRVSFTPSGKLVAEPPTKEQQ